MDITQIFLQDSVFSCTSHILGLFSPAVAKFYEARYLENEDGKPAIVTKFKNGEPVGMVPLNNFVFGTNPRYPTFVRSGFWKIL